MSNFTYDYGEMSVKRALRMNRKVMFKEYLQKTNVEKCFVYGISLGIGISVLYLLLLLTATLTA